MGSFSTSQGGPVEILLPSSSGGFPSDRTSHAAGDDDMSVESDHELCHISNVSSPRQAVDPPYEKGDDRTSSWIVCEDDLSKPQNDGNIRECAEEIMSDLESNPGNTWEPDSSSESDVSDMRSEAEIVDDDDDDEENINVSLESDIYSAKCFLERNWGYTYSREPAIFWPLCPLASCNTDFYSFSCLDDIHSICRHFRTWYFINGNILEPIQDIILTGIAHWV